MKTAKRILWVFATRIVLACCLLVAINHASAQSEYWDVIMLESAEVIRGTITDSISEASVTILAGDSLSRIIPRADIRLITSEVRRSIYTQKSKDSSGDTGPDKSAYYQGIIGAGYGMRKQGDNAVKINFINGIGSDENFSFGLGVGLRISLDESEVVIPLFVDLRIRPLPTRVSPVIGLGGGYGFQLGENFGSTGLLGHAELGISIKNQRKSFVMITIGYETFSIIRTKEEPVKLDPRTWQYSGGITTRKVAVRPVTLNLAFVF